MKITILGSKNFDSLEYHLSDSLRFLGNDVFQVDVIDIIPVPYKYVYWAAKLNKFFDQELFKKISKIIIKSKPELVICTYRFIHPICINLIKNEFPSVPIIHINPDQLTTLEYQQIFASPYDAYFTKDPFMNNFMRSKMGLNSFYLPEAFNPRIHKMPLVEREQHENDINIDVVAFGTLYPYRSNLLKNLIKEDINLKIFGFQDKRFSSKELEPFIINEFISGNRKSEILFGSKIVFNNFHFAEVESVNAKFFEIAGIGGFQICDYKNTIKEYTKISTDKFTFNTIDEAISLIRYYLDRPKERHSLAMEQYSFFMDNHTYEHRLKYVFDVL
jgi:spore maturation protein CgeB